MAGSGKAIAWPRLSMLPPGGALETALLLLLACCISVGQGQDRNWDLLNYHLYNAFSFVEGRFARDLYPVGMQSYFNPLIDLPYYLLSVQLIPGLPRVVAHPFATVNIGAGLARARRHGNRREWIRDLVRDRHHLWRYPGVRAGTGRLPRATLAVAAP
jgi:hypothetical protein